MFARAGGRVFGSGAGFRMAIGVEAGLGFPGLAGEVSGGLPGSGVSGRGLCRVGAFGVSGLQESDFLFITISHCAWRHASFLCPKRQRNEAKKTL